MNQLWTEKYRPKDLKSFKGNKKAIEEIILWIQNWKESKNKAVLLHGAPGVGKTSLSFLLAKSLNYELLDTNASDIRTKDKLKEKVEQAVKQKSLFKKGKIILIDEVDGMGSSDRGGGAELVRLISETKFPLIFTANDAYNPKLSTLRNKCKIIKFNSVHQNSVAARLKEICDMEKINFDPEALKAIARRASGDLRSAINDLESLFSNNHEITLEIVNELNFRDLDQNIFQALLIIFKTKTYSTALDATNNLSENFDMLFNWIRENVPLEYEKNEEIALAYNFVSKANIFKGRIRRRQNWSLLKYAYELLCAGVAISKDEKYSKFTRYRFPTIIKKMSLARSKKSIRISMCSKFSKKLHISSKHIMKDIKFFKILINNPETRNNLIEQLYLEKEEIKYLEDF